jgi:hypothetical protein
MPLHVNLPALLNRLALRITTGQGGHFAPKTALRLRKTNHFEFHVLTLPEKID